MAKRQRRAGNGPRVRFDESQHRRDGMGRFADKPGGEGEVKSRVGLKSAGVNGNDRIVSLSGNDHLNGLTVNQFIRDHPDGPKAALYELAAGHKQGILGFEASKAAGELTAGRKAAIADYTGSGHKAMNWQLRGIRPETAEVSARIASLDDALDGQRLGEAAKLYRGIGSLGAKKIAAMGLKKGSILEDPGFMSTSRNASVARSFAQQSSENIVLEIQASATSRAMDVSKYSDADSGEQEVLFARNSRLKVISWDKKTRWLKLVVLDD